MSRLTKDVARLQVVVLVLVVLFLAGWFAMLNRTKDVRGAKTEQLAAASTIEIAAADPVTEGLAVATVNDYANLEASRIAKMAAVLMDMGGEYEAICSAEYDASTEEIKTEYVIKWYRKAVTERQTVGNDLRLVERESIRQSWAGATWGECIAKMTAWKRGK